MTHITHQSTQGTFWTQFVIKLRAVLKPEEAHRDYDSSVTDQDEDGCIKDWIKGCAVVLHLQVNLKSLIWDMITESVRSYFEIVHDHEQQQPFVSFVPMNTGNSLWSILKTTRDSLCRWAPKLKNTLLGSFLWIGPHYSSSSFWHFFLFVGWSRRKSWTLFWKSVYRLTGIWYWNFDITVLKRDILYFSLCLLHLFDYFSYWLPCRAIRLEKTQIPIIRKIWNIGYSNQPGG